MSTPKRDEDIAREIFDQLADDAAMESTHAKTPEEIERDLVAKGIDTKAMHARLNALLDAAPDAAPAGGPLPPNVVPLRPLPPREAAAPSAPGRSRGARVLELLPWAAAALAVIGIGGAVYYAKGPPPGSDIRADDTTPPPQRSPAELAAKARAEATLACAEKRMATCEDKLNAARDLNPAGDESPAVRAMRLELGDIQPAPPDASVPAKDAAPPPAPQRPPQRPPAPLHGHSDKGP